MPTLGKRPKFEDKMATKFADISDFLKGLLAGVWIGITENPFKPSPVLKELMQIRRETAAEDARTRTEIGYVPPSK